MRTVFVHLREADAADVATFLTKLFPEKGRLGF